MRFAWSAGLTKAQRRPTTDSEAFVANIWVAIVLAATLIGCAPGKREQPDSSPGAGGQATTSPIVVEGAAGVDSTAHASGFGPVRAGMTVAEAELALGAPLVLLGPQMEPCHYVEVKGRPGVAFMVIDGRIARVDVRRLTTVKTAEGAGIGDTEARIQELYSGRVEVQPHKYTNGHYLVVTPAAPADSTYRIIFETDGKRVTSYCTGRLPEVGWVESCS